MRPLSIVMTLLLFALSCTARATPQQDYAEALLSWSQVLAQHVDEQGRVDFAGVAAQPSGLQRYIDAVADYGPATYPQYFESSASVLAYHINTYNAQAMHGVIERGIPADFGSFLKRASFFRLRTVRIDGNDTSLHAYENKVIRPLGEARLHFVLNCMVRDCPRLPRKPFHSDTLESELDAATREFFAHPGKLRVDDGEQVIYLSAILDFYTEDFVASGNPVDLPAYVSQYLREPLPARYRVKFFDYDWTVNAQP